MGRPRRGLAITVGVLLVVLSFAFPRKSTATAQSRHGSGYTVTPGRYRDVARFRVTYTGSGHWRTVYHSEPPNQGGANDVNDASDSSTQRWALTFAKTIAVPRCAPSASRRPEPCIRPTKLTGAVGETSVAGAIAHVHRDGLYRNLDRSVSCAVRSATPPAMRLRATLGLRYSPRTRALSVTALIPVADALTGLPVACPGEGDSIDGLLDNYFMPGFSFGRGFGAARWFTSREIVIPVSILHTAGRIRIPVANTEAGTPPKGCAVLHRSFERCTTTGSWRGVITLAARR